LFKVVCIVSIGEFLLFFQKIEGYTPLSILRFYLNFNWKEKEGHHSVIWLTRFEVINSSLS